MTRFLIIIVLLGMLAGCDVVNLLENDKGCAAYADGLLRNRNITSDEAEVISRIYERCTRPSKRLGQ